MLLCDAPELVRWRPDFSSSGQTSPEWTRVLCAGELVTNSLEWVEWRAGVVQVVLCEACGHTDCAHGGYAQLSRLASHVLLSSPRLVGEDREFIDHQYAPSALIRRHGSLAIPASAWATWPEVPPLATLAPTRRRQLADAWRAGEPPRGNAIATDAASLDDAFALVDAVRHWFDGDPEAEVEALVPLGDGGVTIFYDGSRFTEWTPVTLVGNAVAPVFAGRFTVGATTPPSG